MPFAIDPLDQEKQEQEQQQAGAPAMTGGGVSFGGAGGGTAAMPKQEKGAQKQGSGFVNLNQYMQANKGSGFGQKFTGQVQQGVSQAKQGLEKGAQDFAQASNQGTTRWGDVQGDVQGAIAGAGDQTSDDQVKRVQGLMKSQYQGPESFGQSAYGAQAQGGVSKAGQEAKALQSEGGRFALLDQYYGKPKYSQGQKTLDNLLIQNAPGSGARSQAIGNQAKQLQAQSGQVDQSMGNLAAQNKFATQDAAAQTKNALTGAQQGFATDLNKRYQDFQASQAKRDQDLASQYGSGKLSQEAFDLMGSAPISQADYANQLRQKYSGGDLANMNDQQVIEAARSFGEVDPDSTMGLNLQNYLMQGQQANMSEFATDADYARSLALQKLAGDDSGPLMAADRANAGTAAQKAATKFNKDAYQRDLAERKAAYQDRTRQLMGQSVMGGTSQSQWDDLYNQYGLNNKLSLMQ